MATLYEQMRLAVRKIYYKAVTPSCDVIDLDYDTWMKFLHGDNESRKEIVCKVTGKEDMIGHTREIAWFPLEGQNLIIEAHGNKI